MLLTIWVILRRLTVHPHLGFSDFHISLKPVPAPADEPIVRSTILISRVLILLTAISMADGGTPDSRRSVALTATSADGGTSNNAASQVLPAPSILPDDPAQPWIVARSTFPGYTIRRTVPEVRLQFSVADEHGRLVTSISPIDLRIFDNQSAVQRIRQFSAWKTFPCSSVFCST